MSKTITTLQLIATRKIKQHKNPMYREKGVSLQTKPHTMTRKDFEIMAPVGSRESLAAAIKAGADSIYFGIENLNMRAHSASTFTIDDLKEMAQTCAAHGIKSYLTVNTIIYGEDLPLMRTIIDAAKEADISAVIASDVAVMMYCRQIGQEVHLSTQLNISNIEALKFYAQFADVVVSARELNMTQVADIHRQIEEQRICGPGGELIRIEMFCHGALCMAVSGKCYLSLDNTGRSANRGACMQICRRGYIVKDRETGTELEIDNKYIMSPKDLKTVRFIDRMMEAGVRVFKIEGRARGPEYVATVVGCYQEATKRVGRDVHRREKRRMGRAVGPRVQPWFLGRVLPGTDFRRMDDELRFGRHGKKGLRGQGHQILFQTWRGRVPNRSGGHERG